MYLAGDDDDDDDNWLISRVVLYIYMYSFHFFGQLSCFIVSNLVVKILGETKKKFNGKLVLFVNRFCDTQVVWSTVSYVINKQS